MYVEGINLMKLFDSLYVRANDLCAYLFLVLSLILSFLFMAPNFKTLLQTCPSQTTFVHLATWISPNLDKQAQFNKTGKPFILEGDYDSDMAQWTQMIKLERIYNPITAMGFLAMFTFQLDNTKR